MKCHRFVDNRREAIGHSVRRALTAERSRAGSEGGTDVQQYRGAIQPSAPEPNQQRHVTYERGRVERDGKVHEKRMPVRKRRQELYPTLSAGEHVAARAGRKLGLE